MKKSNYFKIRDVLVSVGAMLVSISVIVVFIQVFGLEHGYIVLLVAMMILILLLLIDYQIIRRKYTRQYEALAADLELKDVLYELLEKTAMYSGDIDFYEDILKAAISAIEKGHKGSIINLRNRDHIEYVAVEGFDVQVLERMALGYEDTYLYKETNGALDRTVIIKNSVNYNQLHLNEALVKSLIEAGTASIRTTMSTPIRLQDEVIGMINIDSTERDAFTEKDIKIIEIFAIEVGKMIRYYEAMQANIYLSHYDAMTQVYNRGYFYEKHRELYLTVPPHPYVFITTDINNLKEVNDTYGHAVGDVLIRHFVNGIKGVLDEEAILGRYGGDEFNILLPDSTVSEAESLMKKVGEYFADHPVSTDNDTICVSYSFGMIQYPDEEADYEQLIVKADQRMYEHKKNMKGQNY